jgi:hypothetical protein
MSAQAGAARLPRMRMDRSAESEVNFKGSSRVRTLLRDRYTRAVCRHGQSIWLKQQNSALSRGFARETLACGEEKTVPAQIGIGHKAKYVQSSRSCCTAGMDRNRTFVCNPIVPQGLQSAPLATTGLGGRLKTAVPRGDARADSEAQK